jgi:protein TonB
MSAHSAGLPDLLSPRTTSREVGLWAAAGVLVLVLHAFALFETRQWEPDDAPAEEAASAIMIDLAPMAVAPEAVPADMAELVESVAVPSQVPPTETTEAMPVDEPLPPETVEEVPPLENEQVETAEAQTMEPEPVGPEVAEEPVPDLVEVPLPDVAMALPTPKPDAIEPEPEPAAKKPVEKKAAEKPARKPVRKQPEKPAAAAKASAEDAPKKAAPRATEGAKSRGESPARWQSRVNAHLNRFKRYPAGERDTGAAAVRFSIDASGRVLSASLSRSSGNVALDKAAVEMVRRASPVPAPPPAIAKARMSLTVPVRFSRR